MHRRVVSVLLMVLLFCLTAGSALAVQVGKTAPDFELKTVKGQSFRLSQLKGQLILLKLSTTWCPTCRQQTQEILAAGNYLRDHGVTVVEVFLQDTKAMVRDYLKGKNYPMPHYQMIDDGPVRQAYDVYLIPRVLFIDKQFKVRRDGSLMTASALKAEVAKILAQKK
ncbi:MAG TPA: TlpA disulfide reductase family protein [Desulfuromonadales bacterium]|nr:TlpA disulfide reductase family protein [Desulfuromonadales bacterium]